MSTVSRIAVRRSDKAYMFEYQAPATLNQAAPVQNTWYTILDTTNAEIYDIGVNVEDTNETIAVQATVDGVLIPGDGYVATHSTTYIAAKTVNPITRLETIALQAASDPNLRQKFSFLIEGTSVKIEVRKTTAAGAGNLTGIVTYGVLRKVS